MGKSAPFPAVLLEAALSSGDVQPLETYLAEHSALPGPRGNLEMLHAFAEAAGALVARPDTPVYALINLLDRWAQDEAEVTEPRVMLPCAAVLAYGHVGAALPDQWPFQITRLHAAAVDTRWRVREMVAAGLQQMLAADWPRTIEALQAWSSERDPLVLRAAAAAVAEPPLLKTMPVRAAEALGIQQRVLAQFMVFGPNERTTEAVRALRQALGYTVSVATAAAPEAGFGLLKTLAASGDADLRWIARENLRKNRLKPWPEAVARIDRLLAES